MSYSKLYSGADPEFIEGDVFRIIIPLSTGSMIKVGGQASGQVENQVILISLDVEKLNALIDYRIGTVYL